jgi:hypothetical protein
MQNPIKLIRIENIAVFISLLKLFLPLIHYDGKRLRRELACADPRRGPACSLFMGIKSGRKAPHYSRKESAKGNYRGNMISNFYFTSSESL